MGQGTSFAKVLGLCLCVSWGRLPPGLASCGHASACTCPEPLRGADPADPRGRSEKRVLPRTSICRLSEQAPPRALSLWAVPRGNTAGAVLTDAAAPAFLCPWVHVPTPQVGPPTVPVSSGVVRTRRAGGEGAGVFCATRGRWGGTRSSSVSWRAPCPHACLYEDGRAPRSCPSASWGSRWTDWPNGPTSPAHPSVLAVLLLKAPGEVRSKSSIRSTGVAAPLCSEQPAQLYPAPTRCWPQRKSGGKGGTGDQGGLDVGETEESTGQGGSGETEEQERVRGHGSEGRGGCGQMGRVRGPGRPSPAGLSCTDCHWDKFLRSQ